MTKEQDEFLKPGGGSSLGLDRLTPGIGITSASRR